MTQDLQDVSAPLSPKTQLLAIKPREARMTVSRILRQAQWDWGLEPAVTSIVLAAHRQRLSGLDVLDRDWEQIRTSRPEAIEASVAGENAWLLSARECHALVAAPSVLDFLIAGIFWRTAADVVVKRCAAPEMLGALPLFGPRYGLRITARITDDGIRLSALRDLEPTPALSLFVALQKDDYPVDVHVWERLRRRSQDYLVPESEISRGHAGDGTRAFPLTPPEAAAGKHVRNS